MFGTTVGDDVLGDGWRGPVPSDLGWCHRATGRPPCTVLGHLRRDRPSGSTDEGMRGLRDRVYPTTVPEGSSRSTSPGPRHSLGRVLRITGWGRKGPQGTGMTVS